MTTIMKTILLMFTILIGTVSAAGQATGSSVEIVTTYSQNGRFRLKSVPYDNEFPSLRGTTSVYETGKAAPLYTFDRGFDSVHEDDNNLILSDDGATIFHVIPWEADETKPGLRSVTIYCRGELFKSYTAAEITCCDTSRERCEIVYSNYEEAVDKDESSFGSADYKKVLRAGTSEREAFLSDHAIFISGDTVYLTDPKKQVHTFDLKTGAHTIAGAFDDLYERLKAIAVRNRTEVRTIDAPVFLDFPRLADGRDPYAALRAHINMKPADGLAVRDEGYKLYWLKLDALISRDGKLEIESIEFFDELPREKIIRFFRATKFDIGSVPREFDRWFVGDQYFYFRKADATEARREKRREVAAAAEKRRRDLTAETIDGVHIPADLGECFVELDKRLRQIGRDEMRALPKRDEMIRYHLSLGMWMRNNWRLWGGSRLQRYFIDKGVTHPEEMSSVIL